MLQRTLFLMMEDDLSLLAQIVPTRYACLCRRRGSSSWSCLQTELCQSQHEGQEDGQDVAGEAEGCYAFSFALHDLLGKGNLMLCLFFHMGQELLNETPMPITRGCWPVIVPHDCCLLKRA